MEQQNGFNEFSFRSIIEETVKKLQFYSPTAIQRQVIPAVMNRKSVVGQSFTGSGKTHAYLLPLFDQLEDKQEVQFVITAPTRELAMQIHKEAQKITHYAGKDQEWKVKLVVGGNDRQKMMEKLKKPPHIIIGTPGRIMDMVKEGVVSLYSAHSFVVDEADLMLDLGFLQEVDQLLVRCKADIQLLAFSATIPRKLGNFFQKYMDNPVHINLDDKLLPDTIEHRLIPLKHRDRSDVIKALSQVINPYLAIIFTNGKEAADELTTALLQKGLEPGLIHGGLTPRERKRMLKGIEQLRYQYIVATDLAARGIDIPGVSHVINAQLPKETDFYVHRTGRAARAGLKGTAISLFDEQDTGIIGDLEDKGVNFTSYNIKNGEWQVEKSRNDRNIQKDTPINTDKEAWKQVRKPKKVKPGYKKKMKKQQEQIKSQLKHQKRRR